jgi:hypothetical protein
MHVARTTWIGQEPGHGCRFCRWFQGVGCAPSDFWRVYGPRPGTADFVLAGEQWGTVDELCGSARAGHTLRDPERIGGTNLGLTALSTGLPKWPSCGFDGDRPFRLYRPAQLPSLTAFFLLAVTAWQLRCSCILSPDTKTT